MSGDGPSLSLLGHALATVGLDGGTDGRPDGGGVRLEEHERHTPPASLTGKVRWLSAPGRVAVAAVEALHGGAPGIADAARIAVLIATRHGPADVRRRYVEQLRTGRVSPTFFTCCGHNVAGGLAATALGLHGTNLCFAGEQAGLHALESALLLIGERQVDAAYVGRIDPVPTDGTADGSADGGQPWFGAVLAVGPGAGPPRLVLDGAGAELRGDAAAGTQRVLDLLLDRISPWELLR